MMIAVCVPCVQTALGKKWSLLKNKSITLRYEKLEFLFVFYTYVDYTVVSVSILYACTVYRHLEELVVATLSAVRRRIRVLWVVLPNK